jgi:hypothetical protein
MANASNSSAQSYVNATGASSLRMEAHRVGAADVLVAAGMSPYHTGLLLLRLQGEWDRASKPRPPTYLDVQRIAQTLAKIPDGEPHAGMVAETQRGTVSYRKPLEVAERTAMAWHLHELGILFGHLKTLPELRGELERWIGGPHAARVVADTLAWWLEPRCQTCRGSGKRIIQGTGGRSTGKVCWACRLSPTPGERPLSHSGIGRRLLSHIWACVGTAAADQNVSQPRTPEQEHRRGQDRKHAQIEKLRRADEETTLEVGQDREAVALRFALGKPLQT